MGSINYMDNTETFPSFAHSPLFLSSFVKGCLLWPDSRPKGHVTRLYERWVTFQDVVENFYQKKKGIVEKLEIFSILEGRKKRNYQIERG